MPVIKKTKAYTLYELLVVSVLTSLVIFFAMSLLNLLQKEFSVHQTKRQLAVEIRLFERTLLNDLQRCEMEYFPEKATLLGNLRSGSVSYVFHKDFVTRNRDTFAVKVIDKSMYLDAVPIQSGSTDALDIAYETRKIFLYRQNDATFYMKRLWLSD
jgi:hypothetical protein